MPRYFFDVTDAGSVTHDDVGDERADDRDARDQGASLLPLLARDRLLDGDQHEFIVSVRSETGQVLYEASLAFSERWWPGP